MTRAQSARHWASLLSDVIKSAERDFKTASMLRKASSDPLVPFVGFLCGLRWLRSARSILADADREIYGRTPKKKGSRAR